jgi:hypothetical protein
VASINPLELPNRESHEAGGINAGIISFDASGFTSWTRCFAIKKVETERERYNLTATDPDKVIISGYTKVMRKSMGLPYAHVI